MSFREATRVERVGEGTFEALLPDGWQQGRGAFGGVVFGTLLRAACASEEDPSRHVRTFACDVVGPVMPGRTEVRVRVLRRGKSQTNMQLELSQEGRVLATGLSTLSSRRPLDPGNDLGVQAPKPPAEALRGYAEVPAVNRVVKGGPVFAQHYEYRVTGPIPYAGGSEPVNAGFVRERHGEGALDAPALCALLDAFWPALFSVVPRGSRMLSTTASFNAQLMDLDQPLPADEPLFFRGYTVHQSHGFDVEFRELWAKDRLVGLNQQTFVILR